MSSRQGRDRQPAGLLAHRPPKLAGSPGLPRPGERVAVVGCGTSWFMAKAYAALREQAGHGETDAFQASEFPLGRRYDRVVAITRSGTTTEVVDLLEAIGGRDADHRAHRRRRRSRPPRWPPTPSCWTSPTSSRWCRPASPPARSPCCAPTSARTSSRSPADAEVAVRLPLPVHPALVEQITFLGRGWTVGLAEEAALKCREAAMFWAEAYPAMDYRHGPISIAAPAPGGLGVRRDPGRTWPTTWRRPAPRSCTAGTTAGTPRSAAGAAAVRRSTRWPT